MASPEPASRRSRRLSAWTVRRRRARVGPDAFAALRARWARVIRALWVSLPIARSLDARARGAGALARRARRA